MINHDEFNDALNNSMKSVDEVSWESGVNEMTVRDLTERDCWDELYPDEQDRLKDALPDLRWY